MPLFSGFIKIAKKVPQAVKVSGTAIKKAPTVGATISSAGSRLMQSVKSLPIVRTIVGSFTGLGIYEVITSFSNDASNAMSDAASAIANTIGIPPEIVEVLLYCGLGIGVITLILFFIRKKAEKGGC